MKKLITVKLTFDEIMKIINLITVRGLTGGVMEPEHKSAGKKLGKATQLAEKKRGFIKPYKKYTAHD